VVCRDYLYPLLVYTWAFDFFKAIVNGIVFLYSFPVCSLLIYLERLLIFVNWLCTLLLCCAYTATLFCLSYLGVFWWRFWGLLDLRSCCLQIRIDWLLSHLNSFYFSSSFILMASNSKTILNERGESGHPCQSSPFSVMLAYR
jgi:hypothetical protein